MYHGLYIDTEGQTNQPGVFQQVFEMDISKQLHAYEVDYHMLQDELLESSYAREDNESLKKLGRTKIE